MKNLILLLFFMCVSIPTFSQDFFSWKNKCNAASGSYDRMWENAITGERHSDDGSFCVSIAELTNEAFEQLLEDLELLEDGVYFKITIEKVVTGRGASLVDVKIEKTFK